MRRDCSESISRADRSKEQRGEGGRERGNTRHRRARNVPGSKLQTREFVRARTEFVGVIVLREIHGYARGTIPPKK